VKVERVLNVSCMSNIIAAGQMNLRNGKATCLTPDRRTINTTGNERLYSLHCHHGRLTRLDNTYLLIVTHAPDVT